MKPALKALAAAAMTVVALGSAHAEIISLNIGDTFDFPNGQGGITTLGATGSATLSFSDELLGALNTGKITVTPTSNVISDIQSDADGYTKVAVTGTLTGGMGDTSTLQITEVRSAGGATLTASKVASISSGGFLTVSNLSMDVVNKVIYADITGGNGVGTLTHFALWNAATLTGGTKVEGPGTYINTVSGLTLTSAGFTNFSKALGLLSVGKAAMSGITDYGSITSTIVAVAVPEPSTYAMMGLGLVGLLGAVRRRQST